MTGFNWWVLFGRICRCFQQDAAIFFVQLETLYSPGRRSQSVWSSRRYIFTLGVIFLLLQVTFSLLPQENVINRVNRKVNVTLVRSEEKRCKIAVLIVFLQPSIYCRRTWLFVRCCVFSSIALLFSCHDLFLPLLTQFRTEFGPLNKWRGRPMTRDSCLVTEKRISCH